MFVVALVDFSAQSFCSSHADELELAQVGKTNRELLPDFIHWKSWRNLAQDVTELMKYFTLV